MSNLTGQQINQTYPGLLNLETATTGITSSLQSIQDGLGNNTGARIGTNALTVPNQVAMYNNNRRPTIGGLGVGTTTGTALPATSQSNLLFTYFYDTGVVAYSSMTVSVDTQTTTSDTLEVLFYDIQYVDDYGWFPSNLIMSGITVPTTPTGFYTITLPSTLSFSGLGGGFYAIAFKFQNGGVTPTVRYRSPVLTLLNQGYIVSLGYVRNNAGTAFQFANRAASYTGNQVYFMTNQNTPATITSADVISRFNATTTTITFGFNLNPIK